MVLETLRDTAGKRTDDLILDTSAALFERAENAERAAVMWEARVHAAELQVQTAERRTVAAERRAKQSKRRAETLRQQRNRPPRPERTRRTPLGIIVEHHDMFGICRVCAQLAPAAHGLRHDDLCA